jgi:hypothetical protein
MAISSRGQNSPVLYRCINIKDQLNSSTAHKSVQDLIIFLKQAIRKDAIVEHLNNSCLEKAQETSIFRLDPAAMVKEVFST